MQFILSFLATICCFATVSSYSGGPPDAACASMIPHHDDNVTQTTPSNYTITLSNNTYMPGDAIIVTLSSSDGMPFKGVFLQARLVDTTTDTGAKGTFTLQQGDTELGFVPCGSDNGAVSHKSSVDKTTKMVTWKAPSTNIGKIQFRATFVKTKPMFWTNVLSEVVTGKNNVSSTAASSILVLVALLGSFMSHISH